MRINSITGEINLDPSDIGWKKPITSPPFELNNVLKIPDGTARVYLNIAEKYIGYFLKYKFKEMDIIIDDTTYELKETMISRLKQVGKCILQLNLLIK